MKNKVKLITSVIGLVIGFGIFGVSLIMASQVKLPNSPTASERRLYMGKKILPDNIFYPILMIADKIILTSSARNKKAYIMIQLSNDRLVSAKMLLDKNQEKLAFSTITKSQKYLIAATHIFLESDKFSRSNNQLDENSRTKQLKKDLLKSLEINSKELKRCKYKFKTINTTPIDNLLKESAVLINQLQD